MEVNVKGKSLYDFFNIPIERVIILDSFGKENMHKALCRHHYPNDSVKTALEELLNCELIENERELSYLIFKFSFNYAVDKINDIHEHEFFEVNKN